MRCLPSSAPFTGRGRARRLVSRCCGVGRTAGTAVMAEQAGVPLLAASSLKAALDADWDNPAARLRDVRAADQSASSNGEAHLPVQARPHHRRAPDPDRAGTPTSARSASCGSCPPCTCCSRTAGGTRRRRTRRGTDARRAASPQEAIGYLRGERDRPYLPPGHRKPAGRRNRSREDHHSKSKLKPGLKGPLKGGTRKNHRSPGAGGSPRPGDNPACPETGEYGELLCPRLEPGNRWDFPESGLELENW